MKTALYTLLIALFLAAPSALADEITLKSGEVIKDCKVQKKSAKTWRIILLDGNRRTIKASDIAEHVEKPTLGDEFDKKAAALGKKDAAGMLELGKWGMEKGIKRKAVKILNKVVKLDKKNAEARQLLGQELCEDGKWRSGKALAKYKDMRRGEKLAAQGWVKIKRTWYDPFSAKCIKAGLTKDEQGVWRTKDDLKQIKKGQFWFEGKWYDPKDRAKIDSGMRREGKNWSKIDDLNGKHRAKENPWKIETRHFILKSTLRYQTLQRLGELLDANFEALHELCGDAPLTAFKDKKIVVNLERERAGYNTANAKFVTDDRAALFSNSHGAYYSPGVGEVIGYYHDQEYLAQWVQHATAQAFMYKISKHEPQSRLYEMIGSYLEGHYEGKYQPFHAIFWNGLREWEVEAPKSFVNKVDFAKAATSTANESRFSRLGFVMHFLMTKHPKIVKEQVRLFLQGKANHRQLFDAVEEAAGNDMAEDLKKFLEEFRKGYKKPAFEK